MADITEIDPQDASDQIVEVDIEIESVNEPSPTPAPSVVEFRVVRGLRVASAAVMRSLAWKRPRKPGIDQTSPASPPVATRLWNGVGGTAFWSVQTLRTVLFLGCLAITAVSAVALFQGLHQSRIAAINDDLPEVTELPHEQLQPSLAGTLPAAPPAALPHPMTVAAPTSPIPPAPTLPVVITADARNAANGVAPAADTAPQPATPPTPPALTPPPAPPSTPPALPSPASPPLSPPPPIAPRGGADFQGGIEDGEEAPAAIIIRAGGSASPSP
jgi:hypothetical protein